MHSPNLQMLNECPNLREFSLQLWALLNPLLNDSKHEATFANVPRHNGLDAWRQLAEPINEDRELVVKDLLPMVTNTKGASNMEGVDDAIRDWNTSIRLFKKAGGVEPPESQKRITLIRMLPMDIGAYVTMHWELPEYKTFDALLKFVNKYIKVLRNLRKSPTKPAHMIEVDDEVPGSVGGDMDPEQAELIERLLATDDVEEQVEILAVVQKRGFRAPTRRQGRRCRLGAAALATQQS